MIFIWKNYFYKLSSKLVYNGTIEFKKFKAKSLISKKKREKFVFFFAISSERFPYFLQADEIIVQHPACLNEILNIIFKQFFCAIEVHANENENG